MPNTTADFLASMGILGPTNAALGYDTDVAMLDAATVIAGIRVIAAANAGVIMDTEATR